jgi:hypothetical protein
MAYSLDPLEVKKVIDAYLNDKPHDNDQFWYYHLYRNYFNVKKEITTLTRKDKSSFVDNFGNVWTELSSFLNFYHMNKGNWLGSVIGVSTPESRKFLLDDNITGLNGQFEMIIRKDGKRIDALTHETYQETYNFGRTSIIHAKLDVKTHEKSGAYTFKQDMGSVKIIE